MHDVVCMRCGEETDWLYHSKNPDYEGWDLCGQCAKEANLEMEQKADKPKEDEKTK